MSGHSKWSKVKHQKASTDASKSRAFTKATMGIIMAIISGGGITDPDKNFKLRLAIDQARAVNMPKDNIERAISKGNKKESGELEDFMYEAYGPGGIAILVGVTTDNRQRTVSVIKNTLERHGGVFATPGSVMYQFEQVGLLIALRSSISEDSLMEQAIEAYVNDIVRVDDYFELFTDVVHLAQAGQILAGKGVAIASSELIMKPKQPIHAESVVKERIDKLISALEELDDVQSVYTNVL